MKILQLSNKSPFPPVEGGPMAMHSVWSGLSASGHQVDVLTMDTPKFRSQVAPGRDTSSKFHAVPVDSRVKPFSAIVNLLSTLPYHASRFISKDYREILIRWLDDSTYDIIQLEGIYPAAYIDTIRQKTSAPIVLRAHNVESQIWERVLANTNNPLFRTYLRLQVGRLRRWEEEAWKNSDGIIAISPEDAGVIRSSVNCPVTSIPFGIDIPDSPAKTQPDSAITLFHLGSMDWIPNQEGIRWFLEECFPILRSAHPGVRLRLAGRHFPAWLSELEEENVDIVGEVENAAEFIRQNDILVVPLLSGSGMRIKIIEALAHGKAVISTSVGMEGIEGQDGQHYMIADSVKGFSVAIDELIKNPERIAELGKQGRLLVQDNFSREATSKQFEAFYRTLHADA